MSTRHLQAIVLCLLVVLGRHHALAQIDPIALQKRAVDRIDLFVNEVRKSGDLRSRAGDLAQAAVELSESNRLLAARGDWNALALGLLKHGHIFRMQGQNAEAIAFYQRAEEAATRAGNAARQSEAAAYMALAESNRTNLGTALAEATRAVRLAETTADKNAIANALDVLAAIQATQGDLAAAAATTAREVAAASQASDPMALYYAYYNRMDVYLKTAAKCDFQRTFELCYEALDRSRDDVQQMVAIVRRLGFDALVRQADQSLREIETRRQMYKSQQSVDRKLQTLGIFQPKRAADVLVTERFIPPADTLPAPLVAEYEAGKRQETELAAFADVAQARTLFVEGLMNEYQGNHEPALTSYLKAIDRLERDRRALRDERSRGSFAESRIEFYYRAIGQFLERRRYAEAFALLERSRSRSLADLMATRNPALSRPDEQRLYADVMVLRTQIADAQSRLFEMAGQRDAAKTGQRLAALQGEIRRLEGRLDEVSARIGAEAPRLQSLITSSPVTLAALQRSMRQERYEMLQYLVQEDGVLVWHIAPDSVVVRSVFLPRSEVMAKVAALQKSLADRNARFDETTSRELFLFLIQPVVAGIRSERLVIVPHEDLQYVPFQVFQDPADGRYVGERFQISYAPSATVLLNMKRSTGLSGGRLLAVADPGIPAATREVNAVASLFSGRSKVVNDVLAAEREVKSWVGDFDVIHLAVHGEYDPGEPMLSRVLLGRDAADDGRLTAAEMFGLPLDASRLVVLSACETGRAEATHANEILGIQRALIYAGAGALVLSHWRVDSDATALWMQTFYQAALSRPLPAAARLALTKVKSDPAYRHPYFWAAFTMVGR